MALNLAQKTYDVFIMEEGRWLIDSHHERRSDAIDRAEELIADKRFAGVRVVSESTRTGEEEVLLEEKLEIGEKALTIVPIEEAPVCGKLSDYFAFPARQAAGRLLRNLLDRDGVTALELAFDYGALRALERNDNLFPRAVQQISRIQAKAVNQKPQIKIDALYAAFAEIKENARTAGDDGQQLKILQQGGLGGLVERAPAVDPDGRRLYVLGGLAQALRGRADWGDKIRLVCELAEKAPDELVREYLDEIAAEVLDGNVAITEFFGGFGDSISAYKAIVHLTQGRCHVVNPRSCIAEFNALMAVRPMPVTKSVLLDRVAASVGGYRALTREGKEADEAAFKALIREMTGHAGLVGGPRMAEAVASRSRMLLGEGEDLALPDALDHLLSLLPNRAVRLGYLLDLVVSPLGRKNGDAVIGVLGRLVQQLTSLSSLVPRDLSPENVTRLIDELGEKMRSDALPEKWRQMFSTTLDRLMKRGLENDDRGSMKMPDLSENNAVPKAPTPTPKPAPAPKTTASVLRREAKKGELLFEEGDIADEAYLIVDGTIEIFRTGGDGEQLLTKLGGGEIVGEMSLIDEQPRMASARVLADARLTVITRQDLATRLNKLAAGDKVLRRLIDVFVDRLRGQARTHE